MSQAYVKMVVVWQIFAQVMPWIEVLPPHCDHHDPHLNHYQHQHHPHRHHQHYIIITSIMIKVLLHTLINWMRTEEESGREVNYPSVEIVNIGEVM